MATNDNKRIIETPVKHGSPTKKRREICSFKEKCYRKHPRHFMEYDHPHLDILMDLNTDELNINIPDSYLEKSVIIEQIKILKDIKRPSAEVWKDFKQGDSSPSTSASVQFASKITFAAKLKCNSPYNIFFTVIPDSPQTRNQINSIEFKELLCPSLGKLKCTLQINFIADAEWILQNYSATNNDKKPMTLLFGENIPNMIKSLEKNYPNVKCHFVQMNDQFGTHHAKMGIYAYEDGSIRVVVSTANLYKEDWTDYCQSVWVSPKLPLLPADKPSTHGCGPTDFKGSLVTYLKSYKLNILQEWIERVQRVDFSAVKVFFVGSIPGKHPPRGSDCHLQRIGDLLSRHCTIPETTSAGILSWSVIAQSSSLGNYGANPALWLRSAFLRSLASHVKHPLPANSNAKLCIVYPSMQNVLYSYRGKDGGGCLPYSKQAHEKQKWLTTYLYQWKADKSFRTRAMPHIKSYCRVSPDHTRLAYFLLTSANISKAAWGTFNKTNDTSYVRSYEVGVLFVPKFFDEPYFIIDAKQITTGNLFPFVLDLPLTPYDSGDTPWAQ